MPIKDNRYCTQIDFTVTRGHIHSDILYTALMKYNRGGKTDMTASQLILRAYECYDPSETEDITMIYDQHTKAQTLMDRYSISNKSELIDLLRSDLQLPETELQEPKKKFFRFDLYDPAADDLLTLLESLRYRDRGNVINRFLYQYFAHGHSRCYNKLVADLLIVWLRDEARTVAGIDPERINFVIDSLWNSISLSSLEDEEKSSDTNTEESERLRKAMGLI